MEMANYEILKYVTEDIKAKLDEHYTYHQRFEERITLMETRMTALEDWINDEKQLKKELRQDSRITRRWLIGLVITVALSVSTMLIANMIK